MVRRRSAAALAVVAALIAASADAQLDRYAGGGQARSPHGGWEVVSPDRSQRAIDAAPATALLRGPGIRSRRLMQFERGLDVVWPDDRRHVVALARTAHFASIRTFTLGARDAVPPRSVEREIERRLRVQGPGLGRIENRLIAVGSDRTRLCLLAEESGLPPGRVTGSYIARRGYFRLDLDRGTAAPTASCRGARLD